MAKEDIWLDVSGITGDWSGSGSLCFHRYITKWSIESHFSSLIRLFIGFEPKYRCTVPLCENTTSATYDLLNDTFPYYVSVGLPQEALESKKSCMYYGISNKEV